jgi:hypothetical protein
MRDLSRYFLPDLRDLPLRKRAFVEGRNRAERRGRISRGAKFLSNAYSQQTV